jgi:glycosyltransferase involved in cell wall biosynthesis
MIEVVIVDDGSTDTTRTVTVEEFIQRINADNIIKKRFKLVYLFVKEGPKGPSASRNHGLEHHTGQYVFFIDSDDIFMDDTCLASLYNEIKRLELIDKRPHFVYGDTVMYSNQGNYLWEPQHLFTLPKFNLKKLIGSWGIIPTGSFIFSSQIAKETEGFNPDMAVGEDFEWQIRVAMKYPCTHIEKTILKYYRGPVGQLNSSTKDKEVREKSHAILNKTMTLGKCTKMPEPVRKHELNPSYLPWLPTFPSKSCKEILALQEVIDNPETLWEPAGKYINVDVYFNGDIVKSSKKEIFLKKILWVLSDIKSNKEFYKAIEKYDIVLCYNPVMTDKIKRHLRDRGHSHIRVDTLLFPFHKEIFKWERLPETVRKTEDCKVFLTSVDSTIMQNLEDVEMEYSVYSPPLHDVALMSVISNHDFIIVSNGKIFNLFEFFKWMRFGVPIVYVGTSGRGMITEGHAYLRDKVNVVSTIKELLSKPESVVTAKANALNNYHFFLTHARHGVDEFLDKFESIVNDSLK